MREGSSTAWGAVLLAILLLAQANDCLHVNGLNSNNQTDKAFPLDLGAPSGSTCRLQGAVDDCCECNRDADFTACMSA